MSRVTRTSQSILTLGLKIGFAGFHALDRERYVLVHDLPFAVDLPEAIGDVTRKFERLALRIRSVVVLQARDECQMIVRVRLHVHDVDLDVRREHRHELVYMLAEGGALELSGTHDIELEHLRRVVEVLHDLVDMLREIVAVQPHLRSISSTSAFGSPPWCAEGSAASTSADAA